MHTGINIVKQPSSDKQENLNVRMTDVLEILDIKVDDFVHALTRFIHSKTFLQMIKKDERPKANNEKNAYPKLHLHVLTNFIINAQLSEDGYNDVIDQFLSGYNDDHTVDTPAIHC